MRALGTALFCAVLLACAACGRDGHDREASDPEVDACASRGDVVAEVDLEGTGTAQEVRLTGGGEGPCARRLLAEGGLSADVAGLGLARDGAMPVKMEGEGVGDLLLVRGRAHPRGGFQPHLFGVGGATGLRELTVDGRPLVPFLATDGGAAPMTATCTDDGVAVLTATASQPPGVVLAWDLTETSYSIRDAEVVGTRTRTVRRDAADPVLRKERPELFDGSLFADCG
jgi:hypothetical protein